VKSRGTISHISPRVVKLLDRLAEEAGGPPLFRVATKYADKAGVGAPVRVDTP
jgi:hypothetical protein